MWDEMVQTWPALPGSRYDRFKKKSTEYVDISVDISVAHVDNFSNEEMKMRFDLLLHEMIKYVDIYVADVDVALEMSNNDKNCSTYDMRNNMSIKTCRTIMSHCSTEKYVLFDRKQGSVRQQSKYVDSKCNNGRRNIQVCRPIMSTAKKTCRRQKK